MHSELGIIILLTSFVFLLLAARSKAKKKRIRWRRNRDWMSVVYGPMWSARFPAGICGYALQM